MTSRRSIISRLSAGVFAKAVSLAIAGVLVVAGVAVADEFPETVGQRADYLVTFAAGTTAAEQDAALVQADAVVASTVPVLRLASVSLTDEGAAELAGNGTVARVEADRVREIQGVPNDPSYADQWALPQIGWDTAFSSVAPTGSATVAVLDTGVNPTPDLDGQLVHGASMLTGDRGHRRPERSRHRNGQHRRRRRRQRRRHRRRRLPGRVRDARQGPRRCRARPGLRRSSKALCTPPITVPT